MKDVYVSIVVASRNDDHDGSLLHRMKLFFHVLTSQLTGYNTPIEIVIVEWNPPHNRPPLKDVLPLPKKNKHVSIRIITVPSHIHAMYKDSDRINLFQFIAKNVGIRRAHGKFILATNIDILFSDQIIDVLAKQKLKKNEMLRAIRFDIPDKIKEDWSSRKILDWSKKNTMRGYLPNNNIPKKKRMDILFERFGLRRTRPPLFTNACGDFTLLSREFWFEARGYPEFPMHGVKIDGLLCYNAHFIGAKERILKPEACIYHIDHPNSWSGEKGEDLQSRLNMLKIPYLSREEYVRYIDLMVKKNKPYQFNDEYWGLANYTFHENAQ